MTVHAARMGEGRSAFKILMCKPTGNRPLGRPKRRNDNIIMDLKYASTGGIGLIRLCIGRALVNVTLDLGLA